MGHTKRWRGYALILSCVLCFCFAGEARSDIGPPVNVHLVSPFQPARVGETFQGRIQLDAIPGSRISNPTVANRGNWQILSQSPVALRSGTAANSVQIDVRALPLSPDEPLRVDVLVDGKPHSVTLDLSQEAWLRATRMGATSRVAGIATPRRPRPTASKATTPPPLRRSLVHDADVPEQELTAQAAAARGLEVSAVLGVTRSYEYDSGPKGDNAFIGVHGASVYLFEVSGFQYRLLVSGHTDAHGVVDLTYWWDPQAEGEDDPDLRLAFSLEAPNTSVVDPTTNTPYGLQSHVLQDVQGSQVDFGVLEAADQDLRGRCALFTSFQRAYEYFLEHGGGGDQTPSIIVRVPNGGPNANGGGSNFPDNAYVWKEWAAYHERGHHWTFFLSTFPTGWTYCNPGGYCDDDPDAQVCNHCIWCNEDPEVTYLEGVANWMAADGVPRITQKWGDPVFSPLDVEWIPPCGTPGECECDPLLTEGVFAAALDDISDVTNENDLKFSSQTADVLSLGPDVIFDYMRTANLVEPTAESFLVGFHGENPSLSAEIWETLANNGYDFDVTPPGAVSNMASYSHPLGVNVPDGTVQLSWDPPPDDWSGAGGYSIKFGLAAGIPDTIPELTDPGTTSYVSDLLPPGTWFASVRAVDRAGRWSNVYGSYGPIEVGSYTLVDLDFKPLSGWADSVVPRGSGDATTTSVPAPTELRGDGHLTWGNLRGANLATNDPCYGFESSFELDGESIWTGSTAPLAPGQVFRHINQGPFFVGGGRHTFVGQIDLYDDVIESDETNNRWGRQWVWAPGSTLVSGPIQQYSSPPRRTGGWDAINQSTWFNVRGLRFTPSGAWTALVMWPNSSIADYDLRLHAVSTGPDNGFTSNLGWSSRPEGCTDAVLINRNVEPTSASTPWDVGVLNYSSSSSNFHVQVVESATFAFGSTDSFRLEVDEMMGLHDFFLGTQDLGWVNFTLRSNTGAPLYLNLFPRTLGTGDLQDSIGYAVLEEDMDRVSLDVEMNAIGHYAVGIYRDAMDGNVARDYELTILPATVDLEPWAEAEWAAPIVPRDQQDLTWPWPAVPLPSALYGDIQPTYAYVKWRNAGPIASTPHQVWIERDGGLQRFVYDRNAMAAGATDQFTTGGGFTVPGGRHILSLTVDALDQNEEIIESNNSTGRQWYWRPAVQDFGPAVRRAAPPPRQAGWESVPYGSLVRFNTDGIRTPVLFPEVSTGTVSAVAFLPEGMSDYDLMAGRASNSTILGPSSWRMSSLWAEGEGDFCILYPELDIVRQWDIGIIHYTGGDANRVQVVDGQDIGHEPFGTMAPRTMDSDDLLHVYTVQFDRGRHAISLEALSGSIDWGISLHDLTSVYRFKGDVFDGSAAAWMAAGGQGESIDFEIAESGTYVLAVWKSRHTDVDLSGSYELRFEVTATGAPAITPVRTRIASVRPNPFNPRTLIEFEVVRTGPVSLSLYNLRGELVRRLVTQTLSSGVHERVWDGTDDQGARVASGSYVARLEADGVSDRRRITLLK